MTLAPGREFFSAKCVQFPSTFTESNQTKDIFSIRTVIIHFWDKHHQEINFKSHLNSALPCALQIKRNTVRFAHVPFNFISLFMFVLTFTMKLKDVNYESHWNMLVFCDQWKIKSDLNISHEKMTGFVSFLLFGFTLVIKLRNFDFKSHWNTLVFFG